MSNATFVAAAYAVSWGALIGYLVHLRRQLRRGRAALEQAGGGGAR